MEREEPSQEAAEIAFRGWEGVVLAEGRTPTLGVVLHPLGLSGSQREGHSPQESRPAFSEVLTPPYRPLALLTDRFTAGRGRQCPAGSGL